MLRDPDPSLVNEDLRPTTPGERKWGTLSMASLWIGMVVCVPTYQLAAGLIKEGMSWRQAVLTILLGNVIVLVPMVLIGHPGTRYGVPFPVLARAAFGVRGAHIPSVLRALVACGWFGIQTWIGGQAIYELLSVPFGEHLTGEPLPVLDINLGQTACFLGFWLLQVAILWRGIESIRLLEVWSAPVLIAMGLLLLFWAHAKAGGFGPMLAAPSQFEPGGTREGQLWQVFFPSLTAMVGFWATLSLNIPDFTRYAKDQRSQMLGQALGLPTTMTLFAFIGVAVTSATVQLYGEPIWDPTQLLRRMGGGFTVVAALFALTVATLSTNIAANVVSPANAFINAWPQRVTFRGGAMATAALGLVMMPWKLLASTDQYIFTWLIGYSALLGPIGGILIADYWVLRRARLDVDALYRADGEHAGVKGRALLALVAGVLPNLPGFLHQAGALTSVPAAFDTLYTYAWFVGFLVAGGVHLVLARVGAGARGA